MTWNNFFNSSEKFMQKPLKVNEIFFVTSSMASKWPPIFKNLNFEITFLQGTLDIYFVGLKNVKNSQFWCHIVWKKINDNKIYIFVTSSMASQWPPTFEN